jgi:hypothetical protein
MGRLLVFRRNETASQPKLPFGRVSQATPRPLDERRVEHRRRMLAFMRSQKSVGSNAVQG